MLSRLARRINTQYYKQIRKAAIRPYATSSTPESSSSVSYNNKNKIRVYEENGKTIIDIKLFSDNEQPSTCLTSGVDINNDQVKNLTSIIDGYFRQGGQHININVVTPEKLKDAMEHPERYPNLTVRVSGYAVHFARLSGEQQLEVINRTFHKSM